MPGGLACELGMDSPQNCTHDEENRGITAATKSVPSEASAIEQLHERPARNITQAVWTIVCCVALPCVPIVVLSTILLYSMFRHRLILPPGWPELQIYNKTSHRSATQLVQEFRQGGGGPAYYMQYNASTITTIASWSGRVIHYLSSSIMALVAFYAARHMVLKSRYGDGSDLPSPE